MTLSNLGFQNLAYMPFCDLFQTTMMIHTNHSQWMEVSFLEMSPQGLCDIKVEEYEENMQKSWLLL